MIGNFTLPNISIPSGLLQQRAPVVVAPPPPPPAPVVITQTAAAIPSLGIITLPDGSSIDLSNVSLSPSVVPTGLFTGTQGVATMAAPTASVEPPVAPQDPVGPAAASIAPPMLGNTDYTIRETPASVLSMLGGLPVSLPPEVTAYLSSQPQIVSPFEGMPSLVGAQNIFGDRSYVTHSAAGPSKARVGLMEMKQLNQAEGYNTTVRPEFLGETYLPFRPEGNDPNVVNDTKLWHQYYTDNKDYRKYLSADEQTELAWLDYRTGLTDKNQFTSAVNQVRENFNLPKKVAFEDFEAHFSIGTKRKKYSDNPYQDLQDYGPSIGGYWNPENDPSETQQVLSNPFVQTAIAVIGNAVGGPVGAAIASTAGTRATGADWNDALKAGAISGLAALPSALQGIGQMASQAATGAGSSVGAGLLGLSPAVTQGLIKGGLTALQGGDLGDSLVSAALGYAGSPGSALSGSLAGKLGVDLGDSVLAKGLESLNVADVAKFGLNVAEDPLKAAGELLSNAKFGTVGESGLLTGLPQGIQDAVRKVEIADVLANLGGPNLSSLYNIASDINLPTVNLPNINLPNINLPNIDIPNINLPDINLPQGGLLSLGVPAVAEAIERAAKKTYTAAEQAAQEVTQEAESVVQPVAQAIERVATKAYDPLEQAIQNVTSVITPSPPSFEVPSFISTAPTIPEFNIPNISLPDVSIPNIINIPNVNLPDVNIPNVNLPNIDIADSNSSGQKGMFGEFNPYLFAGIRFNPRAPVVPTLQPRGQDPLSILLRG